MKQELYKQIPSVIIDAKDIPKSSKVSITIDQNLWDEFRDYCDKHGLKYSTRIGVLINQDIRKHQRW